jgi:CxxC motif-containing protein (DUF1111 family)
VSVRRAPTLAGLAALQRISAEQLRALADPDDSNGDGISGRVALLPAGSSGAAIGRFGWKAAVPDLRTQIARALSLDLGLGSPLLPSAAGDCTWSQTLCLDAAQAATGEALEAPELVVTLLQTYLESLPLPSAPSPTGRGAALFTALGCVACHTAQMPLGVEILNPYSDLLLHDLGPDLADGLVQGAASGSEWRTAPLWGLGQASAFLHDGRATSLPAAILWHGGEAAASVAAYRELNAAQTQLLHDWLLGL